MYLGLDNAYIWTLSKKLTCTSSWMHRYRALHGYCFSFWVYNSQRSLPLHSTVHPCHACYYLVLFKLHLQWLKSSLEKPDISVKELASGVDAYTFQAQKNGVANAGGPRQGSSWCKSKFFFSEHRDRLASRTRWHGLVSLKFSSGTVGLNTLMPT